MALAASRTACAVEGRDGALADGAGVVTVDFLYLTRTTGVPARVYHAGCQPGANTKATGLPNRVVPSSKTLTFWMRDTMKVRQPGKSPVADADCGSTYKCRYFVPLEPIQMACGLPTRWPTLPGTPSGCHLSS